MPEKKKETLHFFSEFYKESTLPNTSSSSDNDQTCTSSNPLSLTISVFRPINLESTIAYLLIFSIPGRASVLVLRTLLAAFFICSGIQMFDFKKNLLSLAGER